MTDTELIARQAKQIAMLSIELDALKQAIRSVRGTIYCIGGPLNDNRLGYTATQLMPFERIAKEIDGLGVPEGDKPEYEETWTGY